MDTTQTQLNPEAFKQLILSKYPNGIASDGTPYAKMDATTLTQKIVANHPDGVTKAGIKYSDYLGQSSSSSQPQTSFGDQPSFKAQMGGAETILPNLAGMVGNVPSDAANILKAGIINPAQDIQKSEQLVGDIYKNRGFVQGTKDIAGGFADTLTKIGEAPGKFLVGQNDKLDTINKLSPIQDQTLKQRDEILQKIQDAKTQGKDTSHLVQALKWNQDSLDSLNSQIGTKEDRTYGGAQQLSDIVKYPIEHPVQTAIAAESLKPETQAAISDTLKPITQPIENTVSSIKPAIQTRYINQIKDAWIKPVNDSAPAYNKATDIYNSAKAKGNDIAETLVNNKLDPRSVINQGKYDTADTVDLMRNRLGQSSTDLLRPSLQQADFSTPKTPVEDLFKRAENNITNNNYITAGTRQTLLDNLASEKDAFAKEYPNGLSLTDLHDNKITYDANAKYSPVGDIATNNKAVMNKAVADSARTLLEDNAPKELNIHAFNAELQKGYQAADYLEALQGKKAMLSPLRKGLIWGGKVAGAGIGDKVGGLLGALAGYHGGGILVSAFENLPNPMKELALRTLKVEKPEVFQALQKYLGENKINQMIGLKLPAPTPLGTSNNPIITPTPSEQTQMEGRARVLLK